ncbi:MAG: purine phosphorylase [Pseudomonadota bacterium]
MKITVLFPTKTEASLFQHDGVDVIISGVGLTATALATLKAIQQNTPDVLILAGIAGAFPDSAFKIGEVVLVESEVEGDLGFFTPDGFVHLAHLPIEMDFERRHTLSCPHLPPTAQFKLARSVSLNAAMAPFIDTTNVDIENMEGAAFFHVCLQEKQTFLELRAISNMVKIGDDTWDMQGSIRALTDGLHNLIDLLTQQFNR